MRTYKGTLTQASNVEPAATELENTLCGEVEFHYDSVGFYRMTCADAFPEGTIVTIGAMRSADFAAGTAIFQAKRTDDDTIAIESAAVSWDGGFNSVIYSDGQLANTPIIIYTP